MDRMPLIVGNWKMHHTRATARAFCAELRERHVESPLPAGTEIGIAPPFTSLDVVGEGLGELPVFLAAQDVHWEPSGAFTGEIAPGMLSELGCRMVIVGHSERRHLFGETDERVARKVAAVVDAGMVPILCVGETEDERDADRTRSVVETQLRKGLERIEPRDPARLVVAYEPVWAIGTGRVATPGQVEEVHGFLRDVLASIGGRGFASGVRILYGGSVKPGNAAGLAGLPHVDGFLVGGASLEAATFARLSRLLGGGPGAEEG